VPNTDPILWAIVNAIKELKDEIEQLRGELKSENAALQKRLEQLESTLNLTTKVNFH